MEYGGGSKVECFSGKIQHERLGGNCHRIKGMNISLYEIFSKAKYDVADAGPILIWFTVFKALIN